MGLSTTFTDMTKAIASDLASGGSSRQSLGGGGTAFGWTSSGKMPRTLADFVTVAKSAAMTFPVTLVAPSSTTPATVVPPGGPKPAAVTITSSNEPLVKHAGLGEANLEDFLSADGLAPAIASVLAAGCLMSFEGSAMGVLDADAGDTATGTTWVEAITNGQATVIGAGGSPGLLVVSSADYGALLQEIAGGAGFAQAAESAIGAFFGSLIHASPKLAAGKAFILDPGAVICVEHETSPIVVVDTVSQASTNKARIVADVLATTVVTNAGLVVEATVTAP